MIVRLLSLWDSLRRSYWGLPAAATVAAACLGTLLPRLDASADAGAPWLDWAVGPSGARAVLSIVGTSLITVTGVVFSITIVSLTLASRQYGPRVLRSFTRDTGAQAVMGVLLGGYAYSVVALSSLEAADGLQRAAGLTAAFGLASAMAGVAALIYFIDHVASSIQAAQVIRDVSVELEDSIGEFLGDQHQTVLSESAADLPASPRAALFADRAGYLRTIDCDGLIEWAAERGCVVKTELRPGDFVFRRAPILTVCGADPDPTEIADLRGFFFLGAERSFGQDLRFGLYQLVEIAVRALSPGVNDPHTAITAVNVISDALARLAAEQFPDRRRLDAAGALRLVEKPLKFEALLATGVDDVRRSAARHTVVNLALLRGLAHVVRRAADRDRRLAAIRQAELIRAAAVRLAPIAADREEIEASYRELVRPSSGPAQAVDN